MDHIGGATLSVLTSCVMGHEFKAWSGQTKNHRIGICCFSDIKYAVLRGKSKYLLAQNQDNVSERSDMFTSGLL